MKGSWLCALFLIVIGGNFDPFSFIWKDGLLGCGAGCVKGRNGSKALKLFVFSFAFLAATADRPAESQHRGEIVT